MAIPVATVAAGSCHAAEGPLDATTFMGIGERTTRGAQRIATRGWRRSGIGAATYRRIAARPPAHFPWASRATATSRDGYHYQLDAGATIEVDQFGALGDDETNDYEAIQAAIAFWQMSGGTLAFTAARHYFVGTWFGPSDRIFIIDHLRDAVIDGRGATIRAHSAGARCQTYLFTLRDFRRVTIRRLRATDRGTDLGVNWRGLYFVSPDANLGPCETLILDDVIVTDAVVLLFAAGTLPQRVRDIRVTNCSAIRCYYGLVFAENGDAVRAVFKAQNCRRAYYAYGVTDHRVDVAIDHDDTAFGADACCVIKCYSFDTSRIDLTARFRGSVSRFTNLVKLEHQPTQPGRHSEITDIRITLNLREAVDGIEQVTGIGFSSYAGPQLEAGPTANRWSDIVIAGDLGRLRRPITAYTVPASDVTLFLDGATLNGASLPSGFKALPRPRRANR